MMSSISGTCDWAGWILVIPEYPLHVSTQARCIIDGYMMRARPHFGTNIWKGVKFRFDIFLSETTANADNQCPRYVLRL